MSNLNKEINIWRDYLPWGFAMAAMLSLLGNLEGVYSAVLVLLFMITAGVRDSAFHMIAFMRAHYLLTCAVVLSTLYFYTHKGAFLSYMLPGTLFLIVFAGYRVALSSTEDMVCSIKKMELIAFFAILFGLIWFIAGFNDASNYFLYDGPYYQSERLISIFVHPLVAASILMACTILMLGLEEDIIYKTAFILLGSLAIILTSTRMAIMVYALALITYLLVTGKYKTLYKRTTAFVRTHKIISIAVLFFLVIIAFAKREMIAALFAGVAGRFAIITKDVGTHYRWDAWSEIVRHFFDRPISVVLAGSGMDGGYQMLHEDDFMINLYGHGAGAVDNMLLTSAYDYGLMGLVMFLYITIISLLSFIKPKSDLERTLSLSILCIMSQSLTSDFQYWPNISFVLYVFSGLLIGIRSKTSYE